MWRFLMGIGMLLHKFAPPRPPKPAFSRQIQSTVSGRAGSFQLQFYVPKDWDSQRKLHSGETRSGPGKRWGKYPVVINYHGGGFTLGHATDDARWCGTVVAECQAIVVSVDYRLAPEHPFPTAVEDGVDAVLWINQHAQEFGIDTTKIALSGFSSGANMAFTVPLRLYDEVTGFQRGGDESDFMIGDRESKSQATTPGKFGQAVYSESTASSSTTAIPSGDGQMIDPRDPPPQVPGQAKKSTTVETVAETQSVSIRCIIPWYPSTDYTHTREQRRATMARQDQQLPQIFTDLFDESYLHPPGEVSLDSPYLSPGVAPLSLLRNALPHEIIMYTCEFDMLLKEGEDFRQLLVSPEVGKNVVYKMVPGVPHGWDKAPNPLKPTPGVREHYLKACKELRRCFGESTTRDELESRRKSSVAIVR